MAARDLGTAVLRIVADVKGLANGLKRGGSMIKQFSGNLRSMSTGLQQVATAAAKVAAVGAALFGPIILQGQQFEQTMAQVKAVTIDSMRAVETETNTVGAQFQSLVDRAREMGATTTFTASQAAEAMNFLGQAGLTAKQVYDAIPDTLNLARAGMLDLGTAADIATDIMSAFALTAKDINRIADNLAQAARSSNTNIEQMGQAFKFVAPIAGALGQNIEQISGALAVLAQRGLRGSIAGTGLARTMQRLAQGGDKVVEVLAKYSLTLDDVNPATTDLNTIMRRFATVGISAGDAMDLFGARAGRTFLVLKTGIGSLSEMRRRMESSKGAAQEMAEIMRSTVQGGFLAVMSKVQELGLLIWDTLTPSINNLIETAKTYLDQAIEWVKANQQIVGTLAKVGTVITAAAGAIAAIALPLSGVIAMLATFGETIGIALAGLAGLATNPSWGILVAAVLLLSQTWREFVAIFQSAWDNVLRPIWEGFVQAIMEGWENNIKPAWDSLVAATKDLFNALREAFDQMAAGESQFNSLGEVIADVLVWAIETLIWIVQEAIDLFTFFTQQVNAARQAAIDFGVSLGLLEDPSEKLAQRAREAADETAKWNTVLAATKTEFLNAQQEMGDFAAKQQRMISIMEKGETATANELKEFAKLRDELDAGGKTIDGQIKKQEAIISKQEEWLASARKAARGNKELQGRVDELSLSLTRNRKILRDLEDTREREQELQKNGVEAQFQSAEAARAEAESQKAVADALNERAGAQEALGKLEGKLAEVREKIAGDRLKGFARELAQLDARVQKERELANAVIENAQKIADTEKVLQTEKLKNIDKLLAKEREALGLARTEFERKAILEDIATLERERAEEAKKSSEIILEQEEKITDAKKALIEIEQANAERRAELYEKERQARNDFIRDLEIEENKRRGQVEAAARGEFEKKKDMLKRQLDERFDLNKAANEKERKLMIAQRKQIEEIQQKRFEDEFLDDVGADLNKDQDQIRDREVDQEKTIGDLLLNKARSLRDIFAIQQAIFQLRLQTEMRAVAFAKQAIQLRERAAMLEKKAAEQPANEALKRQAEIARLEADAAAAIAQKRQKEAGIDFGEFGVEAAKQEALKIVKEGREAVGAVAEEAKAENAKAIEKPVKELSEEARARRQQFEEDVTLTKEQWRQLGEEFLMGGNKAKQGMNKLTEFQEINDEVDRGLADLESRWQTSMSNIVNTVQDGMGAVKHAMNPDTRSSPSLNDVLGFSVEAVRKAAGDINATLSGVGEKAIGARIAPNGLARGAASETTPAGLTAPIGNPLFDPSGLIANIKAGMTNLKEGMAQGPDLNPLQVDVPQVQPAGGIEPQIPQAMNDNRTVNMEVNNNMDADDLQRRIGQSLAQASMMEGGI